MQKNQDKNLEKEENELETSPLLGMRWFYFQIYFGLYISAIICAFNALFQLTGITYTVRLGLSLEQLNVLFQDHESLPIISIVMSVLYVFLSIFAIYTRVKLAKFKENSEKLFLYYIWGQSLLNYSFSALTYIIIGINTYRHFVTLFCDFIYWILNKKYFKKRKFLFDK